MCLIAPAPLMCLIAQELPEQLAPFCRFRTDLAPPEISGDQRRSSEIVGDQRTPRTALAPPPPGPATLEPAATGHPLSPPSLYLVDLSALQFVLLNTANSLQRRVRKAEGELRALRHHPATAEPLGDSVEAGVVSVLLQHKQHRWFKLPSSLSEGSAPSASLDHLKAAPTPHQNAT